ncbi:MAG: RidA family protein [Opitutae bacterium]|jgi:enamine deaminase RidA (YjgF/YER057c/UK114 family)|nr:RidA family protein [Opitutae bacterium]
MTAEESFVRLGIELPPAPKAAGLYKPLFVQDGLAYFSGHLPLLPDGGMITGKVGENLDVEEGFRAAHQVGLNVLATVRESLGSLDRVERVIKLLGMVNAGPDFTQHPQVINGCSELFRDVWGEDCGVGTRSAFGVSGLPAGACVEIEGILSLRE